MQEEIGVVAGVIWQALNTKGELSLAQLKKEVNGKRPIFDWAVGWLAREEKIIIASDKRSFRIRLTPPIPLKIDWAKSQIRLSCACRHGLWLFVSDVWANWKTAATLPRPLRKSSRAWFVGPHTGLLIGGAPDG